MRKFLYLVVAVTTILATATIPARAITYGEPDAGEHPYVGFMVAFDGVDPGWFSCTVTALDARTMLTAGHCTHPVGHGGADVWVTFEESDVLAGWPARADYPDEATLYAARSAWLNGNSDYTKGTAIPHPKYDDFAEFPVNHDVGVVELGADAPVSSYGQLAPLGTAELLVEAADGPNDALVDTVGYGVQSVQPKPQDEDTRYKATSRIVELEGNVSRGGNLHTLNNPSAVGGRGGSCFGDSGGPVLVPETNQVIAVVSFGDSATCHGADYSWRVDTVPSREFLSPFL